MPSRVFYRTFEGSHDIGETMARIGVDPEGIRSMTPKGRFHTFRLKGIDPRAANIVKQEFLAKGAEAAIAYHCLTDMDKCSDLLLMGTEKQYGRIIAKLEKQPFGLGEIAGQLKSAIGNLQRPRTFRVGCGGFELAMGERTLIMGVLNATPDSFSDGGQYSDTEAAIARGLEMVDQGADVIDVGGESTRPGSSPVDADEESGRVLPVISGLAGRVDVPISIDTRKPEVAMAALDAGASIINDVSGLTDPKMMALAAERDVPVVIMHMLGDPESMQDSPEYGDDVVDSIVEHLSMRISKAEAAGIGRGKIIVDPGIGFGKTQEHNLAIIRRLHELHILGCPVMLGASRKSFLGQITGTDADRRLEGSLAAAVMGVVNGADIVRVHDVAETRQALSVADAVLR